MAQQQAIYGSNNNNNNAKGPRKPAEKVYRLL